MLASDLSLHQPSDTSDVDAPSSLPLDPPSGLAHASRCWICWDDLSASSPHAHPRSKRRRSIIRTCEGCKDQDLQYAHQHCFEKWIDSAPTTTPAAPPPAGAAQLAPPRDPTNPAALLRLTRRVLSSGPWGALVMAAQVQLGGADRAQAQARGGRGRRNSGPIKGGKRDQIPYRCNRCLQNLTLDISTRPLNPFVVMYRESGLIIILAYAVSLGCAALLAGACTFSAGSHLVRRWWMDFVAADDAGMGVVGLDALDGGFELNGSRRGGAMRAPVPDAVERMGWGPVAAGILMSSLGWWLLIKFILDPFDGRVTRHVRGLVKQLSDSGAMTDTEAESDATAPSYLSHGSSSANVIRPLLPSPSPAPPEPHQSFQWWTWPGSAAHAGTPDLDKSASSSRSRGGGSGYGSGSSSARQRPGLGGAAFLPAIPEVAEDEDEEEEEAVSGFGVGGLVDLLWELAGVGAWRGGDGDGED
ncbi:hypothetical protein M427DRAFT_34332 [Gonapodya prolifera JEL478]|uniref:RING-CH-type domain-containing protein n=1 Tax=Gonapodya prolifera (strain JEL478) TaxID=1344416 RepID=A0A139A8P8_GONPJ|nr:hypothetical protein M427DRAFT_34332 [Gonapodya prolifera JEL478]|eukprot:KXS13107.1 hypothetical protein M427DRAFT_34332 [Gonapodya prolifera JEL478]